MLYTSITLTLNAERPKDLNTTYTGHNRLGRIEKKFMKKLNGDGISKSYVSESFDKHNSHLIKK